MKDQPVTQAVEVSTASDTLLIRDDDSFLGQVFLGLDDLFPQLISGLVGVAKREETVPDAEQRV